MNLKLFCQALILVTFALRTLLSLWKHSSENTQKEVFCSVVALFAYTALAFLVFLEAGAFSEIFK